MHVLANVLICVVEGKDGKMTVGSILKAIQKHAGRVKNGKHHFSVNDQMNAIIGLCDIGLNSIDIDTSVAMVSECAKIRRE